LYTNRGASQIMSFDATYWNYKPTEAAQVKKSLINIAREIRKEIERIEFPSQNQEDQRYLRNQD